MALCREGEADILMKGTVNTDVILRAILDRENGLGRGGLLSNITVFESPTEKRLLFMSDPAVNISPDVARKVEMIRNAIWVAQRLGFARPKVAVLAAIEKINAKDMPATADAAVMAKMGEAGQFGDADIAGPYALDIAVSLEAAQMQAHQRAGGRLRRHPALPRHQLGQHLLQVAGLFRRPRDRQRDDRREDAAGDDFPLRQLPDEALHDGADRRVGRRCAMSRAMSRANAAKKRDLVIVVNPGSTSTKLAVYRGAGVPGRGNDRPSEGGVGASSPAWPISTSSAATPCCDFSPGSAWTWTSCLAVAGRGGLTKPLPGGVYRVNARMLRDLRSGQWGEHPSNLGAPAGPRNRQNGAACRRFIADPVVVDEFWPLARYAGHPAFERKSRFHALSQRAAARRAARELGVSYEKANFIVVHMGGGISIGAHRRGRVVDVNDALDGDGPFSPERSGSLPTGPLVACCFSGKHTHAEVWKMLVGHGGMYAYLGTNDCREVEERIRRGDAKAREVYEAMAYQIAKWVGASAAVLSGQVKAVVVTGGMARSKLLIGMIRKYAGFVAPFMVYPEIEEMIALASSAQAAMAGKIKIQEYR